MLITDYNFSDDDVCGICKTPLTSVPQPTTSKFSVDHTQGKTRILPVAIISVIIILFLWVRFRPVDQKPELETKESQNLAPIESKHQQAATVQKPSLKKPIIEGLIEYELVEDNINTKVKFVLTVRINKKATDRQLWQIAEQVKSKLELQSYRGAVFFLLPEMVIDNRAWAAVDYLPSPSVRIIGPSMNDENIIVSNLNKISDYLGLWVDNSAEGRVLIRIRLDKSGRLIYEYIDPVNPKPSDLPTYLQTYQTPKGKIFADPEDPMDKFLLLPNGDLEVYDNNGYVITYKNLKIKKKIWNF